MANVLSCGILMDINRLNNHVAVFILIAMCQIMWVTFIDVYILQLAPLKDVNSEPVRIVMGQKRSQMLDNVFFCLELPL